MRTSPSSILKRKSREKHTSIVTFLVFTTFQLFSTVKSQASYSGNHFAARTQAISPQINPLGLNFPSIIRIGRGGSFPDDELPFVEDNKNNKDDESGEDIKIPTLFQLPEENSYDRYAACLGGTEGLRNVRHRELSKVKKHGGILQSLRSRQARGNNEAEARAESKYILNSSKVIKAFGLSIPQFNQLGREVMENEELKEKVMEQAYLYRLSSSLSLPNNRVPIISDQMSLPLLKAQRRRRIQMFARSKGYRNP